MLAFSLLFALGVCGKEIIVPRDSTLLEVQRAFNEASSGDVFILAARVYTGEECAAIGEDGFNISSSVSFSIRGRGASETIIDCDKKGKMFCVNCMLRAPDTKTHVSFSDMTLKRGAGDEGGAVRVYSANVSFHHVHFIDNAGRRGGAVFGQDVEASFDDCVFLNNQQIEIPSDCGGAAMLIGSKMSTWRNCIFDGNTGSAGGALCSLDGNMAIINSTFVNNHATVNSSNPDEEDQGATGGGAILVGADVPQTFVYLEDCLFMNNTSAEHGGAICTSGTSLQVRNCTFNGNEARRSGGAILASEGEYLIMAQAHYTANTAHDGGALAVFPTVIAAELSGLVFRRNTAQELGGAILLQGFAHVSYTEFEDNRASQGGAIYCYVASLGGSRAFYGMNGSHATVGNYYQGMGGLESEHISLEGASLVRIEDSTFTNNYASALAMALYFMPLAPSSMPYRVSRCAFLNDVSLETYPGDIYYSGRNAILSEVSFNMPMVKVCAACHASFREPVVQTLQSAIRAAGPGQKVVGDGRQYHQCSPDGLSFDGKDLVMSDFGIDCEGSGRALIAPPGTRTNLSFISVRRGHATVGGGGLLVMEGAIVSVADGTFESCQGGYGGAIYNLGSLTLNRVVLMRNQANNGGAVYSAIPIQSISTCTFFKNNATDAGGAVHLPGIAVMETNKFESNEAINGGGAIAWSNRTAHCRSCVFESNRARCGPDNFGLVPRVIHALITFSSEHGYLVPGDTFSVNVGVYDEFNTTMCGPSMRELEGVVLESTGSATVVPEVVRTIPQYISDRGVASFNGLQLIGFVDRTYTLEFRLLKSTLPVARLPLTLFPCRPMFRETQASSYSSCTPCPPMTYKLHPYGECESCPDSEQCASAIIPTSPTGSPLPSITAIPRGYYTLPSTRDPRSMERCETQEACLPSQCIQHCSAEACNVVCHPYNSTHNDTGPCAVGYTGRMCTSCLCEDKDCFFPTGGQCVVCPPDSSLTSYVVAVSLMCVASVILASIRCVMGPPVLDEGDDTDPMFSVQKGRDPSASVLDGSEPLRSGRSHCIMLMRMAFRTQLYQYLALFFVQFFVFAVLLLSGALPFAPGYLLVASVVIATVDFVVFKIRPLARGISLEHGDVASVVKHRLRKVKGMSKSLFIMLQTGETVLMGSSRLWPRSVSKFGHRLQPFSLSTTALECVDSEVFGFEGSLYALIFGPAVAAGTVFGLCLILRLVKGSDGQSLVSKLRTGMVFILYVAFFPVFKKCLSVFACDSLGKGDVVLREYPVINCYDRRWNRIVFAVGTALVGYSVVIVVLCLNIAKKKMRVIDEDAELPYNFLFSSYKRGLWWFEAIVQIRRLMVAAAASLVPDTSPMKNFLTATILFCALLVQVQYAPHQGKHVNLAEAVSLAAVLLSLIACMAIETFPSGAGSEFLALCVILGLLLVIGSISVAIVASVVTLGRPRKSSQLMHASGIAPVSRLHTRYVSMASEGK